MPSLQDLPCELLSLIMEYSGSSLISLVTAYPTALVYFTGRRNFFIERPASQLLVRFGTTSLYTDKRRCFPSPFISAARLRHFRQARPFEPCKGRAKAEMRELVNRYMFHTSRETNPLCRFSLSALCAMWAVGEDVERIANADPEQALAEMTASTKARLPFLNKPEDSTETHGSGCFTKAALNFEVYCLTFFGREEILFKGDQEFRARILVRCQYGCVTKHVDIMRFYCILYYVMEKHRQMLASVVEYLGRDAVQQPIVGPSMLEQKAHLIGRNKVETLKYIHYLASQGLEMLTRLERMDMEELTTFTLSTFNRISTSHHPDISMTSIGRGFPLGTQEPGGWSQWEMLDTLTKDPEVWDEMRTDKLPFGIRRDDLLVKRFRSQILQHWN